ncbi:MAG: OmpA family protein [Bacteroidota bacterium]
MYYTTKHIRSVATILLATLAYPIGLLAQFDLEAEPWRKSIYVRNATHLNTEKTEYAPTYYQDGLVFISDQKRHGPIDKHTGERYMEIYYAPLDANGDPQKPREFSYQLNSRYHEGASAFDELGERIYFTRTNQKGGFLIGNKKGNTINKIYQADAGKLDWENVQELAFNNDNFHCMHPTLSPSGDRLYFVSDMPGEGAQGSTDIYFVEWDGDRWGRPQNLGANINTPAREAFPFIHDSGVLFFASQGHNGVGGYDIFMVNLGDEEAEREVINLGKPFNSVKDDVGFIMSRDGTSGFFASNREGGEGRDDIYSFQAVEGIKSMRKTFKLNTTLEITDADSDRAVVGASARVFEYKNGKLEEDIYDYTFTPKPNGTGWDQVKSLKEDRKIRKAKESTDQYGEAVFELEAEKEYLILLTKSGYDPVELTYSTIGKLEPERVRAEMHVHSCFDLVGIVRSSEYKSLSFAAVTITNECTKESRTITSNVAGQFIYCLEAGCKFTILAERPGFTPKMTSISTEKLRGNRTLNVEMQLKAVSSEVVEPPLVDIAEEDEPRNISEDFIPELEKEIIARTDLDEKSTTVAVNEGRRVSPKSNSAILKTGSTIILENIYYESGEHAVAQDAARELDELIRIMKGYPMMEIRMIAYTDVKGTYENNLKLSDRRVNAVKRYLIERGIAARRINAVGLGETKIRNHCATGVKCTDREHAYNRRTEVTITNLERTKGGLEQADVLKARRP